MAKNNISAVVRVSEVSDKLAGGKGIVVRVKMSNGKAITLRPRSSRDIETYENRDSALRQFRKYALTNGIRKYSYAN